MAFWGSLSVVVVLALVHLTIGRWRFLRGDNASLWLSMSAGTALAYVFTYLLPKLADIQAELTDPTALRETLLRNHAYLFALAGLLTYFALQWSTEPRRGPNRKTLRPSIVILLQITGYSFYSLQLGYLTADLPVPGVASYLLLAVVLGLHLMGIDHHLYQRAEHVYDRLLRYCYVAALVLGWLGGILTDVLETTVMYSSTFVAGGIIITAIREELPGHDDSRPGAFVLSVIAACTAILTIQHWQAT
ncbi:MAG: hypothetical protein ACWGPN_17375 [Gammaproteobacteria bacterium]